MTTETRYKKLTGPFVARIKDLSISSLLVIFLTSAVAFSLILTSMMSLFFHGVIRVDFLITGFIASLLVAGVIIYIILGLIQEIRLAEQKLRGINSELSVAIDEIKKLEGILPVCAYCKKIENKEGGWEQLEVYISKHSETDFSHGICPDCRQKNFQAFSQSS